MDAPYEIDEQALEAELTPEQLEMIEQEAKKLEEERMALLQSLAGEIEAKFTKRQSNRQTKETEWIQSYRLYLGSLSSDKGQRAGLQTLNSKPDFGNSGALSAPDHNLVKTKCDIAVAQGISLQFAGGDKNWDIVPTPVASLEQKEAEIKAEAMETEIDDQLTETKYGYKCRQAYEDRVVIGTGVLKGPLPAREAQLTYDIQQNQDGSITTIPTYRTSNKPVLFRVDPWMFFPDDTVADIEDATDAIELHPMSKAQVARLTKNPGFFPESIAELLKCEPQEYSNATFSEYASLTNSGQEFLRGKYAVLEYHGPITIDQLGALGIEPSYDPLGDVYYGEVWVCQGYVLRVELETISGAFELPYAVCPWLKDPGSIFGFGLPQLIKDPQRLASASLAMIQENSSASSGPQIVINKSFIEPADGNWEMYPQKIWLSTDYTMTSIDQAFKQFEVRNVTDKLFPMLNFAREIAQEESGVPLIAGGMGSPQVGTDNATGMAIMQQQSTTVSDFYAEQWDDAVTEKIIRRMYHWNMQYNPKPEIIGDFDVDVRSSTEYRNKQLFIRDIEKLSVEAAQNPALADVINMPDLQRVRLSMMHLPTKTIIKSEDQIRQEQEEKANNPPPPDPQMLKAQADMMKVENDKERIALEREKLQFEYTMQQRREEMDHAEKLGAIAARQQEAQARVIEAESEREIELMKLAQVSEAHRESIMAQLANSKMQDDSQRFLAGMKFNKELRDQALTAEEMRIKRDIGTGI